MGLIRRVVWDEETGMWAWKRTKELSRLLTFEGRLAVGTLRDWEKKRKSDGLADVVYRNLPCNRED